MDVLGHLDRADVSPVLPDFENPDVEAVKQDECLPCTDRADFAPNVQ
jgi:hypothetical protein